MLRYLPLYKKGMENMNSGQKMLTLHVFHNVIENGQELTTMEVKTIMSLYLKLNENEKKELLNYAPYKETIVKVIKNNEWTVWNIKSQKSMVSLPCFF